MLKQTITTLVLGFGLCVQVQAQQIPSKADIQFEMGQYKEAIASYEQMNRGEQGLSDEASYKLAQSYSWLNQPSKTVMILEHLGLKSTLPEDGYTLWYSNLKKLGKKKEAQQVRQMMDQKGIQIADFVPTQMPNEHYGEYKIAQASFNSKKDEYAPTYYNGKLIYLTNSISPSLGRKVSSSENYPFVLVSDNQGGNATSQPIKKGLADIINDGPASFATGKNLVAYSRVQYTGYQSPKLGNGKNGSIYFADLNTEGHWVDHRAFPFNELGTANLYPTLSADGNTLYFASNRTGGFGGFDIYKSEFNGRDWSAPQNLGSSVNTKDDEISPSLINGKLIIASNGHPGYGGYDLFVLENGKLTNVGMAINSSYDDYCLASDDNMKSGYFTSNRPGGNGAEDIYFFVGDRAFDKPLNMSHAKNEVPKAQTVSNKTTIVETSNTSVVNNAHAANTETSSAPNNSPEKSKTIYTIQIAAVSKISKSYNKIENDLSRVGHVYKVFYQDLIKIRLGQYDTRYEAEQSLNKVKNSGYRDAFIVTEELFRDDKKSVTSSTTTNMQVTQSTQSYTQEKQTTISQPEIPQEVYEERLTDLGRYRIKLASYTDISNFDDSNIKELGTVLTEVNGEWTTVYLGDYITIEDGESIRVACAQYGFTHAEVYGVRDGKLIKMR